MSEFTQLRDWMFRTLMFEADAERLQNAGIRIGADLRSIEARLTEEALLPYNITLRNRALQMARLYAQLYCFENSIRELIRDRLEEIYGPEWWEKGVTGTARKYCEDRKSDAEANSWLAAEQTDVLTFADFGHLTKIIIDQWEHFRDLIPSQHWLKQRMDELEKARNFVAHNRKLEPTEFQRIEMYLNDWNSQVGV